jgi:predicted DNA binding CopG/RHH family protein
MANYTLDQEEQEILDAFESGEIQPTPNAKQEIEKHRKYAAATFKKDKRINIHITSYDIQQNMIIPSPTA